LCVGQAERETEGSYLQIFKIWPKRGVTVRFYDKKEFENGFKLFQTDSTCCFHGEYLPKRGQTRFNLLFPLPKQAKRRLQRDFSTANN